MASTLVGTICIKHPLSGSGIECLNVMLINYKQENVTFRLSAELMKSIA